MVNNAALGRAYCLAEETQKPLSYEERGWGEVLASVSGGKLFLGEIAHHVERRFEDN